MNRSIRCLVAYIIVSAVLLLLSSRGDAQGEKSEWKPIVPKEVYQELVKREIKQLEELFKDKLEVPQIRRAKFGAVLLAALTLSVKDGVPAEELEGLRQAALSLAVTLQDKTAVDDAKKLAAKLANAKPDPNFKLKVTWNNILLKKGELMDPFSVKDKKGDGLHPDLQSDIRLKGALNGIEEKIHALAMKELAATAMKKEAWELELLGYRSAVVAAIAYHLAPPTKADAKDPQEWRKLSVEMRDQSISLAEAAKKGDGAGVFKASGALNSACSQCHTLFR